MSNSQRYSPLKPGRRLVSPTDFSSGRLRCGLSRSESQTARKWTGAALRRPQQGCACVRRTPRKAPVGQPRSRQSVRQSPRNKFACGEIETHAIRNACNNGNDNQRFAADEMCPDTVERDAEHVSRDETMFHREKVSAVAPRCSIHAQHGSALPPSTQMKIVSHVASRRNRCRIVVVFEVKKEIPVGISCKASDLGNTCHHATVTFAGAIGLKGPVHEFLAFRQ